MKPLHFTGSSKKDLSGFPDEVKRDAGFALYVAQMATRAYCNAEAGHGVDSKEAANRANAL
jgi:phage-related protein